MTPLSVAVYRGRLRKNIGIPVDDPSSSAALARANARLTSENKSLSRQVEQLTHDLMKARQLKRRHPTKLTCGDIVSVVAQFYEISPFELMRQDNIAPHAQMRCLVCYLARSLTGLSLSEIGRELGRNHASISSAIRRTTNRLAADDQLERERVQITFELERLAAQ